MKSWQRAPLWLRLVTSVLLLATVALLVSGLAGGSLLRGYLVDQVDRRLAAVVAELQSHDSNDDPVLGAYRLLRLDAQGQPLDQWLPQAVTRESQPQVEGMTSEQATARRGRPFTAGSASGDGRWRVVAIPYEDDRATFARDPGTLIVATSLAEVDETVTRLRTINMLVGLAVLGGLALAGYATVRSALRPLAAIERTAGEIAAGDLTRRVPDPDPGTEVGRLGYALNIMLDHLETAFRDRERSEATALSSESRMRRFVADASHELRTPLTSIRGFAELYRQGALPDPAAVPDVFRRIEDEATRMGLLVDDLLVLARLDQERPLALQPVDLGAVARDAVEAARAVALERHIELTEAETEVPAVVGDETRLRHVVSNLLDNALRHTPPGTKVEVSLGLASRDEREWAVLAVRDHGAGLSAEQAERVFERFYRTDAARTRTTGGTGLGLSIVAAIVAAHGGRAEVDTAPGQGATFRVLLPVANPRVARG